jgi:glycosyltransferase involved in cell wall biosynthesis
MKILHVSTAYSWRGGEQQVAYLAIELQKKKIDQVVCCPSGSPLFNFCKLNHLQAAGFTSKGIAKINVARLINKLCQEHHMDLIHTHDAHAHTSAVMGAILFRNKIPVVVSRRVDFPVSSNPLSRLKYNHSVVKKIICVSNKIKEITAKSISDKSKLSVVHSGIDTEKFSSKSTYLVLHNELNLEAETILIGNVSALAVHKDYYTFIDTAESILKINPQIHFVIIGDGPERNNIVNYIQKKNLGNHIHLTGFRKDIIEILPELSVFLMTSMTEGLGTTLLDALAAKVPVVATEAGGIPEIIRHEQTGLLAPVKDADKLSANVLRIIQGPALRNHLIKNGLELVQRFSKENTANATLQQYNEVLSLKK